MRMVESPALRFGGQHAAARKPQHAAASVSLAWKDAYLVPMTTDHGPGDDGPVVVAPGLGAAPRVQRPLATAGTLASAWFSWL